MKKTTLIFLLISFVTFGVQSCKKSNIDDPDTTVPVDPEPEPVSLVRGKWMIDTGYVDISVFGNSIGSQDLPIEPGSYFDFFSDTQVASYDGSVMDTSTYINNDDKTLVMDLNGVSGTFDILELTETNIHLYFDSTTTDPNTGVEALLQFNMFASK